MRPFLAVCVLAAVLGAGSPAAAQTIALTGCPRQAGFLCGVLPVPLDRSGRVPGWVPLHFAVQGGRKPILFALSGGPGQGAVSEASLFATSLAPALDRYRLAVVDQRGTGASGALNCGPLQRLSELSTLSPSLDAACATRLGPRRAFYSTADTVLDLDALRRAFGAQRIALMGVSYGTFVAEQYARRFPTHVSALILDSVVGEHGIDAFSRDTYARMSRVLRAQCAARRCPFTHDPVADLAALDQRLLTHPLRGTVPDTLGWPAHVSLDNAGELVNLVVAGDSNAFLQPAIPGAIAAALHGDPAPLLRLRSIAVGPPVPRTALSAGLNIATFCEDSVLPYSVAATPLAARPGLVAQALAAVPTGEFGPVDRQTALHTSLAEGCELWPRDPIDAVSTARLPDVRTLILEGQLDLRTPLENGAALTRDLAQAQLVVVPGLGHDELDSDPSSCAMTALQRFTGGTRVGNPCAHVDDEVTPFAAPPPTLAAVAPEPGTGGARGRVAAAVVATVIDGYESAEERAFAGFNLLDGGGLRAGRYVSTVDGALHLIGDSYVPGVTVSGHLEALQGDALGTVQVRAPGGLDGTMEFGLGGSINGQIGGRAITAQLSAGAATVARARGATAGPTLSEVLGDLARARRARRAPVAG